MWKNPEYPLLGQVPVLVGNPGLYFAEMYYQYGAYCSKQESAARRLASPFQGITYRKKAASMLKEGMLTNAALLGEMVGRVEPHFSKRDLLNVVASDSLPGVEQVKAFQYLKRDWCGLPEDEHQLSIITTAISEVLGQSGAGKGTALFLGAGAGRVACDLSSLFSQSYATDLALPMAFFFDKIMNGETIDFYEINTGNILSNENTARKMQASAAAANISADRLSGIKDRLTYFIADASSLPVRSNSIDCVISVYFTDVVPFIKVFPEINRVLRDGGTFIHFGPFANNFSSFQAMFSAEDIRSYLFDHGYASLFEGQVHTEHMKSSGRILTQAYDNWLFSARKDRPSPEEISELVGDDWTLEFNSPVQLSISGELSNPGEPWRYNVYNTYKGKSYEDAEQVIHLLKMIDDKSTIGGLISLFPVASESENPDPGQQIRTIIRYLIKEGVLTAKKPAV